MPQQVEDDSVSLQSTSPSEGQDEYVIDGGILAERMTDKKTYYLVKWEGYGEHRNTWELEESFTSTNTFKDWQEKKMRITRGLDKPFDVHAFEKRQDKIMEEISERKRNRRLKRRHLGIHVSPSPCSSDGGKNESNVATLLLSPEPGPSSPTNTVSGQRQTGILYRQQSLQPKIWTDQERRALEAGILRVGGPWWNTILIYYGPYGKVNQDLRRMNESDLQQMVSGMEKEFLAVGRKPPNWLADALDLWLKDEALPDRVSYSPGPNDFESLPQIDSKEQSPSTLERKCPRDSPTKLKPPHEVTKTRSSLDMGMPNFLGPVRQSSATFGRSIGPTPQNRVADSKAEVEVPEKSFKQANPYDTSPTRFKLPKAKSESPIKRIEMKSRPRAIARRDRRSSDSSKLFNTWSAQYWAMKRGREEHIPRLNSLALINPGIGRIPKTLPVSPLEIPTEEPEKRESPQKKEPKPVRSNIQDKTEIVSMEPATVKSPVRNAPDDSASLTENKLDSVLLPENAMVVSQSTDVSRRERARRPVEGLAVQSQFRIGNHNRRSYPAGLQVFGQKLRQLFRTAKHPDQEACIEIEKTCLAVEYRKFYHLENCDYLGWGYVDCEPACQDEIRLLATRLATDISGALFFAEFFSMVIYPVGSDAWGFFDRKLPAVPEGVVLRFVVRKPLHPPLADTESLIQAKYWTQNPERYHQIKTSVSDDALTKGINVVFQETYGIDYHRLLTGKKPNFFLFFVPAGCESYEKDPIRRQALRLRTSEEHDLTVDFLQRNGAKVFSPQEVGSTQPSTNGSWDFFVRRTKPGVVIIHNACIRIDQIPNLAQALQNNVVFWRMSLEPMGKGASHPHLIRLFPYGAVICLTASLMLYRPHEALRILMWFRLAILSGPNKKLHGTWRLCMRPHVRPWLLAIMQLYADTQTDVFGCGDGGGGRVFADLYMNITWLLGGESLSLSDDDASLIVAPASFLAAMQQRPEWNLGVSRENQKPVVVVDDIAHDNLQRNDDALVTWFAEWAAVVGCTDFRRFHVVSSFAGIDTVSDDAQKWNHVEMFAAPESFFERHRVPAMAELDAMDARRGRGGSEGKGRGREEMS